MLLALSTGHEIGLAVAGAIFITFALLSSFVFPRFDPDFPGKKGLRWYIPVACLFFVMMLSSVMYFGREQAAAEAKPSLPSPGTTTGSSGTTTSASGGQYAGGDAASGKALFNSLGCNACHTFTPAGAKGTVGPNLDTLADYAQKAGMPVDDFTAEAIVHPPAKYVPPGFPTNIMQPGGGHTLTPQQVKDLVAFLTSSS